MNNEQVQQDSKMQITCPHCNKQFWAKFGHVLKEVGTAALDAATGAVLGNLGAFQDK